MIPPSLVDVLERRRQAEERAATIISRRPDLNAAQAVKLALEIGTHVQRAFHQDLVEAIAEGAKFDGLNSPDNPSIPDGIGQDGNFVPPQNILSVVMPMISDLMNKFSNRSRAAKICDMAFLLHMNKDIIGGIDECVRKAREIYDKTHKDEHPLDDKLKK